ncbi:DUF4177 domain-containing protein [Hymenobacter sp. BT770]|uniref:DUF4177 domain-containing protein n=1 Tax=Hymenobacter sp. BT770 TaxID=2886942 RepID=UPI001D10F47A|nr:DUF4177 domain-containing protein [Hymenobacter sp. BT770]MCC3152545.1 DUF4177 domain-containing protein [Hymenobacter sp. BT770]MDO3414478.1 DUF4177 domain-containing protein [Hymenobacter sp. BT770]
MKQFEYRLLDTVSGFFSGIDFQELTNHLNGMGREGWEVVSVVDTIFTSNRTRGLLITLKRELSS